MCFTRTENKVKAPLDCDGLGSAGATRAIFGRENHMVGQAAAAFKNKKWALKEIGKIEETSKTDWKKWQCFEVAMFWSRLSSVWMFFWPFQLTHIPFSQPITNARLATPLRNKASWCYPGLSPSSCWAQTFMFWPRLWSGSPIWVSMTMVLVCSGRDLLPWLIPSRS